MFFALGDGRGRNEDGDVEVGMCQQKVGTEPNGSAKMATAAGVSSMRG